MPPHRREKILPIILAAGPSPNLPFPKALARFGRKTALQIAIDNCKSVGRPYVVLGSKANRIKLAVPKSARIIINRQWRRGQLSSLQAALQKIPRDTAFLIYPVDHPLVRPRTIQELVRAFRSRSPQHEVVMPRHKNTYGHPVIVSTAVRPEFFCAATARDVIYRLPARLRILDVNTPAIFTDFNSEETYEECRRKFLSRLKHRAH